MLREQELSHQVIGAAIDVHRALGPGLLESAYEECLCHELLLRNVPFQRQVPPGIRYRGLEVKSAYRIDVLVNDLIIHELKAVEKQEPVHKAQLLTYLRLSSYPIGILLNFCVPVMKDGIVRHVL